MDPRGDSPEHTVYLEKAAEAISGANRELAAHAYNNAANRAYYAAYHAALAALWVERIRPASGMVGSLSHQLAQAEWAGELVRRRHLYPADTRGTLQELRALRERADYWRRHITGRQARHAVAQSQRLVDAMRQRLGT